MSRRAIIAVVGGGEEAVRHGSESYLLAKEVGQLIGLRGGILLCGGGTGVMEAAARGAKAVGYRTIGIMKEPAGTAKDELHLMVWTGLGEGRNYVNAAAADAIIALSGEAGTLSEIALALKLHKPVFCLKAWEFLANAGFKIRYYDDPVEVVGEAFRAIHANEAGFVEAPITYPQLPDQSKQYQVFAAEVEQWSKRETSRSE